MQKCVSKKQLDCIYLTKESKDETLKILEPRLSKEKYVDIVEDDDREVVIHYHYGWDSIRYFYNHWYVKENGYEFNCYTNEEFKNMFEIS